MDIHFYSFMITSMVRTWYISHCAGVCVCAFLLIMTTLTWFELCATIDIDRRVTPLVRVPSVRVNTNPRHQQHLMEISNIQNQNQNSQICISATGYTISNLKNEPSQYLHNYNNRNPMLQSHGQYRNLIPINNACINNNLNRFSSPSTTISHSSHSPSQYNLNLSSYKMYYINVASSPMLIICPDNV